MQSKELEGNALTVIDFFCGAGGFSEGFRQAGIKVIWAVDLWQPAVDTHTENHPEATTIKDDVIRLAYLPDDEFEQTIPDSDVIIGSPPCTAFSNSNKSGKADKGHGIALFEAYLRIVARKKFKKNSVLKYWLLENVPKVQGHIKERYTASDLKLEGDFELIVKGENAGVYNAQYYGVPSNRQRFFCGEFPQPTMIFKEDELIPLKTVLTALGGPKEKLHCNIVDPNYGMVMSGEDVSDHHYIQELAEFEWRKAKRLKQDKGYMGKMSLPENSDRPARTIMATMSFSARESFILGLGLDRFRAPTIREVASLMSFPIDYRFYGSSISLKYKLVGNSVPPRMASAFAKAILKREGLPTEELYRPIVHGNELDFTNLNFDIFHINKEKPKYPNSKFKYHVPYFIYNSYRVELTNRNSDFEIGQYKWDAEIHYSQGDRAKWYTPGLKNLEIPDAQMRKAEQILTELKVSIRTFNEFQRIFCLTELEKSTDKLIGPFELLEIVRQELDVKFNFRKEEIVKIAVTGESVDEIPLPIAIAYYILTAFLYSMRKLKYESKSKNAVLQ